MAKRPEGSSRASEGAANELRAAGDFACLHAIIRTKLAAVKGISDLGYYDIARRIGEWRRPADRTEKFFRCELPHMSR
jgi:hypothetical protein